MELNDWNSDLMTVEETARLLHVPLFLGPRTHAAARNRTDSTHLIREISTRLNCSGHDILPTLKERRWTLATGGCGR
jgi:hypothetical protein